MSKPCLHACDLARWTTWGWLRWASNWPVGLPWWGVKWLASAVVSMVRMSGKVVGIGGPTSGPCALRDSPHRPAGACWTCQAFWRDDPTHAAAPQQDGRRTFSPTTHHAHKRFHLCR